MKITGLVLSIWIAVMILLAVVMFFGGTHTPRPLESAAAKLACNNQNLRPKRKIYCTIYRATGRLPNEHWK